MVETFVLLTLVGGALRMPFVWRRALEHLRVEEVFAPAGRDRWSGRLSGFPVVLEQWRDSWTITVRTPAFPLLCSAWLRFGTLCVEGGPRDILAELYGARFRRLLVARPFVSLVYKAPRLVLRVAAGANPIFEAHFAIHVVRELREAIDRAERAVLPRCTDDPYRPAVDAAPLRAQRAGWEVQLAALAPRFRDL